MSGDEAVLTGEVEEDGEGMGGGGGDGGEVGPIGPGPGAGARGAEAIGSPSSGEGIDIVVAGPGEESAGIVRRAGVVEPSSVGGVAAEGVEALGAGEFDAGEAGIDDA